MTCGCNDKCELPKALQINNPGEVTLFHRVEIPASQGDDTTYPPKNGLYRNVLLVYLANNHSYLYNSDGIPTRVDGPQGETGPAGPGVAPGGEAGQVLAKNSDSDYDTTWITQVSANDATLTISRNDTPVGTFTANASVDKTIDIEVPTKTSDLTNDGATGDSTYVEATALSDYYTKSESDSTFVPQTRTVNDKALSSDITLTASDVGALPDSTVIPTVNDATLTIQKNGTTVETFTANSSANKTANITVPTKTSDLANDGEDGTSTYVEAGEFAPSYISGEGTDITLLNAQGGRFSNVEFKGDTEQTTYSGKNLFNASAIANTNIVVSNNGQTITMPVVSTGNGLVMSNTTLAELCPTLAVGDRVYLQMNTTSSVNKYIWLNSSNYLWFPTTARTITATDLSSNVGLYANRIDQGETIQVVISDLRIVRNLTDAFEPYVGGVASPNPDYPQDVNVVTGEQTVAVSTKNLITLDAIPDGTSSGVSKTFTGSEILLNGTTTGAGGITASTATGVTLPAGTYTFTLTILGGTATFPSGTTALYIRNGSNGELLAWNLNTRPYIVQTRTLSVATPIKIELYTNAAGQIYNNYRLGLQIESGSTATSYEPYQRRTYSINLGTTELCKIGDYQDYIYKNNGTWYLHKATDRITDNGTKNYQARTNTSTTHSKFYVSTDDLLNYPIAGTTTLVSDHFIANIGANGADYSGSASCGSTASGYTKRLWYSVPNSIATTAAAFKTWIAANPVTTYYAMATPTDTPITGTLLDDLNALDQATSYQGDTYITVSSVSPDLPAILSVTTEEKSILPTATEANAGVVSVGDGLEITEGGVLSLADNVVYSEDPGTPIGEVVDPYTYSTTETRIGTWINGKPLYRKVVDCGALPNATVKYVAHGLSNFRIRNIYGTAVKPSDNTTFVLPVLSGSFGAFVTVYTNAQYIAIDAGSTDRSAFTETYITLEYTKTTD